MSNTISSHGHVRHHCHMYDITARTCEHNRTKQDPMKKHTRVSCQPVPKYILWHCFSASGSPTALFKTTGLRPQILFTFAKPSLPKRDSWIYKSSYNSLLSESLTCCSIRIQVSEIWGFKLVQNLSARESAYDARTHECIGLLNCAL
jgi:hypothetical protein